MGSPTRVRAVCLDVAAPAAAFAAAGLAPGSADRVLMNPPFNAPQNPSPDRGRRLAHTASQETLAVWLSTAARLLRPSGAVTLIWRADGLGDVLAALAADFGAVSVLPVHPKPGCAGDPRAGARRKGPQRRRCRCCRDLCSPTPTASRAQRRKPCCATVPPFHFRKAER